MLKRQNVCWVCTDNSETASQIRKEGFACVLLMRNRLVEAVQLKQNKNKTITILSQAEECKSSVS